MTDSLMKQIIFLALCFFCRDLFAAPPLAKNPVAQIKAISFEDAVDSALGRIEEVQGKESELRAAEISRLQSGLRFLPDLAATGTYQEYGAETNNRSIAKTYGLRSNLNLFRFGGDYFYYRSADFSADSARWDLQNTKLKMEETLALKGLAFISAHQETEIRKKLATAQQDYFNVAQKRYDKGILSKQELDQVTIDLKIAEARWVDAQLAESQAQEDLKIYFGDLQLSDQWPWLGALKKVAQRKLDFNIEQHPEWKYLQTRNQAADYYSKNKFSEILPSLDLSVSYLKQQDPTTNAQWVQQWSGLVTLTVPLFNRLENYSTYKIAAETQLRNQLDVNRANRELKVRWQTAETDFRTQLDSALTREQTLKLSNNLYKDNLRRFQAGRTSANDLFNDQQRLYQSELLTLQGWRAAHESYVKLCHALGQLVRECKL